MSNYLRLKIFIKTTQLAAAIHPDMPKKYEPSLGVTGAPSLYISVKILFEYKDIALDPASS
jgi:hypothetical protein